MNITPRRFELDITTTSTGSGSADVPKVASTNLDGIVPEVRGILHSISYVPASASGERMTSTADLTITGETTGMVFATWSNFPGDNSTTTEMKKSTRVTGNAITTSGGATSTTKSNTPVYVSERLNVNITGGGDGKSGKFHVVIA